MCTCVRSDNELILATDRWLEAMPAAVEAVFYLAREPTESAEHAREVRDAFVGEFGLRRRELPLLRLNLDGARLSGTQPFELGEHVGHDVGE